MQVFPVLGNVTAARFNDIVNAMDLFSKRDLLPNQGLSGRDSRHFRAEGDRKIRRTNAYSHVICYRVADYCNCSDNDGFQLRDGPSLGTLSIHIICKRCGDIAYGRDKP